MQERGPGYSATKSPYPNGWDSGWPVGGSGAGAMVGSILLVLAPAHTAHTNVGQVSFMNSLPRSDDSGEVLSSSCEDLRQ